MKEKKEFLMTATIEMRAVLDTADEEEAEKLSNILVDSAVEALMDNRKKYESEDELKIIFDRKKFINIVELP